METENFYIQSLFFDTITNGMRDDINKNPERLGFILGALCCDFKVSLRGRMAKYGKIEIYLRENREDNGLNISIFKGKEKQCEMPYNLSGFLWDKVKIFKGRFNIEGFGFICSTT